jgi:hypothetical protein
MCTVVACIVAILTVLFGKDMYAGATLVSTLIAFSTGGKALQKFAEMKGNTAREMSIDTREPEDPLRMKYNDLPAIRPRDPSITRREGD